MPKKVVNVATPKMVELYQSCIGRLIRRLQKRLAKKAIREPEHRFDDLFNLMYHPKWVEAALKQVLSNQGSRTAGIDGVTKQHLKNEKNREALIQNICSEMRNESYKPQPARRIYIDKSSGGKRPLGISTLKDRVVQQVLKLIVEPIFESDFLDCSIGFRPNRCCHDALPVFYRAIQSIQKFYWVIEGDITGCYDNISHKILLKIIKKRIKDKKILGLIKQILSAGYIENGVLNKPGYGIPKVGTPQGNICSPLFANIYLHEFDKWFDKNYGSELTNWQRHNRRKAGSGNAKLIRYADDFAILWNGGKEETGKLKRQVKQFLKEELELGLNDAKTLITHVNDGLEFLGFHIKRYKTKSGHMLLTSVPSEKVRKFKQKIQRTTNGKGAQYESTAYKIIAMNRIINGWAEYYKYTNWKSKGIPTKLDFYIYQRMFRWAKRKHRKLSYKRVIGMYKHRQTGCRVNGRTVSRWNFGIKTETSYVTDEEILWLAKLCDKPKEKYLPKRKLNPFITYQYVVESQKDILGRWEGRDRSPYIDDEYWRNKKLALKRDNKQCRLCGKKVTVGVDNHCHHIDGNSNNHSLDNLATLCMECHYQTYGREHEYTF